MKRVALIIFLFLSFVKADLVDLYRAKGINAVIIELEKELQKKSYWDKYLINKDVSKGYYESIEYIIYANKEKKRLKLFKKEEHRLRKIVENSVITGQIAGDKVNEGD